MADPVKDAREYIAAESMNVGGDYSEAARIMQGLLEQLDSARQTLEEFAKHGLRADLTPTRYFGADASVVNEYRWWCAYISRADENVRSAARAALKEIDV